LTARINILAAILLLRYSLQIGVAFIHVCPNRSQLTTEEALVKLSEVRLCFFTPNTSTESH